MTPFIGYTASVLSTIAFLPQAIYVIKSKDSKTLTICNGGKLMRTGLTFDCKAGHSALVHIETDSAYSPLSLGKFSSEERGTL